MYLFHRAFAYLRKQIAKTSLLFILFFLIGNIVLAGFSVQFAATQAERLTRQEIGTDITYRTDTAAVQAAIRQGVLERDVDTSLLEGVPTYANVRAILADENVASVDLIATYEVTDDDLTPYTYVSTTMEDTQTPTAPDGGRGSDFISGSYESSGDFTLSTFTLATPTIFANDTATLTDGRFATDEEIANGSLVVLIHETLAENNDLQVGDTLTMTPTLEGFDTEALNFTIIGIYSSTETVDDRMASMIGSSLLPQNKLYTPFTTLTTLGMDETTLDAFVLDSAVIQLVDPENLESFRTSAESSVTLTYGILDANDSLYQQMTGSLDSLSNISKMMLWIVVLAGASILALITALTVNQRKNEIGILLAIGESKGKIVTQFIVEVLAIAILAFTLSIFSGIKIGQTMTDTTLANYKTSQTETFQPGSGLGKGGLGGIGTLPGTQEVETVDVTVSLNWIVLLELFGSGLAIAIVSVMIPALYVTRFNPKQILTNNG